MEKISIKEVTINSLNTSNDEKRLFLLNILDRDPHLNKKIPGVDVVKNEMMILINKTFNLNIINSISFYGQLFDILSKHPDFEIVGSSRFGLSISRQTIISLDNFFGFKD